MAPDASSRYWNRDDKGHMAMQTLVEYDSRELHPNGVMKGGWYIGPQETGRESVLDPLPYVVQGKHVWLATLPVPISRAAHQSVLSRRPARRLPSSPVASLAGPLRSTVRSVAVPSLPSHAFHARAQMRRRLYTGHRMASR